MQSPSCLVLSLQPRSLAGALEPLGLALCTVLILFASPWPQQPSRRRLLLCSEHPSQLLSPAVLAPS